MYSSYDQLVDELNKFTDERNAEIAERSSIIKSHSDMVASKKTLETTLRKTMSTLTSLRKSATAMVVARNKKLVEQVPAIMMKAQKAFLNGQITGDQLCMIEAKKNRLCSVMAIKGIIR